MADIDFISSVHKKTKRDYVERVARGDKAVFAQKAKEFSFDYWDGDRACGYGGYKYDGRWASVAEKLIKHYDIKPGQKILDVGCGKGFLLYEFKNLIPDLEIKGIDISEYAINNAKPEIKGFLDIGSADKLLFADNYFDFVVSITTLHNLYINDLFEALKEIERVKKNNSYIVVESYRNEQEKDNLLNWQLTCEAFFTPEEWQWIFQQTGYTGDYGFIYFE